MRIHFLKVIFAAESRILRLNERLPFGFLNGDGRIGIAVEKVILKQEIAGRQAPKSKK